MLISLLLVIYLAARRCHLGNDCTYVYNDDVNNTHLFIGNHDNSSPRDSARDVELERCGAYKIVRLSKQKVVMNENPAYGEVGRSRHIVATF